MNASVAVYVRQPRPTARALGQAAKMDAALEAQYGNSAEKALDVLYFNLREPGVLQVTLTLNDLYHRSQPGSVAAGVTEPPTVWVDKVLFLVMRWLTDDGFLVALETGRGTSADHLTVTNPYRMPEVAKALARGVGSGPFDPSSWQ